MPVLHDMSKISLRIISKANEMRCITGRALPPQKKVGICLSLFKVKFIVSRASLTWGPRAGDFFLRITVQDGSLMIAVTDGSIITFKGVFPLWWPPWKQCSQGFLPKLLHNQPVAASQKSPLLCNKQSSTSGHE